MNYRNLLVHLDDSQAARQRLEIALRVARQFDAQLVGLDITPIPDAHILSAIPGAASMYTEVMRQSDQQRAALRDLFDAACRHADVAGQFRCRDASDMRRIVRYARLADLIIAGQSNPNVPETYIHDHVGELLMMTTGRPVLFAARRIEVSRDTTTIVCPEIERPTIKLITVISRTLVSTLVSYL
ncbi:universal stress protein [Paraburkholderia atlantica]|uniref:universal stress protein n=1 Tax=Paraburkholderia atlantica TaxID=2654982 RepID=UPI0017C665EF|nr:universal stress protein [Paraburkholderia atlantica]MBB5510442.1 nucleotide-binding universal stress UspA family protein [Paraburkholderia atlantica]